jgi:hypothetical protein
MPQHSFYFILLQSPLNIICYQALHSNTYIHPCHCSSLPLYTPTTIGYIFTSQHITNTLLSLIFTLLYVHYCSPCHSIAQTSYLNLSFSPLSPLYKKSYQSSYHANCLPACIFSFFLLPFITHCALLHGLTSMIFSTPIPLHYPAPITLIGKILLPKILVSAPFLYSTPTLQISTFVVTTVDPPSIITFLNICSPISLHSTLKAAVVSL